MVFIQYFTLIIALFGMTTLYGDNIPIITERPIHEGYTSRFTDITPPVVVPKSPPEDLIHDIPPKIDSRAIWIPGYWVWIPEKNDYSWICGVWRIPPPDHEWISGSWIKYQNGWTYVRGFWSLFPEDKLDIVEKTPPNPINDNPPPAPDENSFWAYGHWKYSETTKKFGWMEGIWQPYDPDWVLTPAHYVWTPKGYAFIDPYWDYPINKRGALYNCTNPPSMIPTNQVIQSCIAYYPDYINWIHHWWHFNPGWFGDCWCTPPWWHWNTWWSFSWHDHWDLWWWFGHPGFPQPFWLTVELSQKMAPPADQLIELMKKLNGPDFIKEIKPIKDPLKPSGKGKEKSIERPTIPSTVKPIGKIALPKIIPKYIKLPKKPVEQYKPQPVDVGSYRPQHEEPSLTPLLDTDRPDYSDYEPLYEYKYQPQYRYQPDYYYKPYRKDEDEFPQRKPEYDKPGRGRTPPHKGRDSSTNPRTDSKGTDRGR